MDQPQDSIVAVRTASGVADFTLHPLRDTAAHWLIEELGVRGDVVEDLLSLARPRGWSGPIGAIASLSEMRTALELWSTKLDGLLAGRTSAPAKVETV